MARNDGVDVRSLQLFNVGNPTRAAVKYRREEVRDIPPMVTTMNQSGIVAMITLFVGLLVWVVVKASSLANK